MILLIHILFGAAIGHLFKIPIIALTLAYLSHYFLDLFPHIEYPIKNIKNKQWNKSYTEFLVIFLDFFMGFLVIFILLPNQIILYLCGFLAIVPDGFTILEKFLPNKFLNIHSNFHRKKIHFLMDKKIPLFYRLLTQISFLALSLIILSK